MINLKQPTKTMNVLFIGDLNSQVRHAEEVYRQTQQTQLNIILKLIRTADKKQIPYHLNIKTLGSGRACIFLWLLGAALIDEYPTISIQPTISKKVNQHWGYQHQLDFQVGLDHLMTRHQRIDRINNTPSPQEALKQINMLVAWWGNVKRGYNYELAKTAYQKQIPIVMVDNHTSKINQIIRPNKKD